MPGPDNTTGGQPPARDARTLAIIAVVGVVGLVVGALLAYLAKR